MSKDYTHLIIHCSATYEGVDIRPETIREWHMGKNGRGWSRVGYSDIITIDGALHNTHFAKGSNPYDDKIDNAEITWGVRGMNQYAKHVCYIGGLDKKTKEPKNTLTPEQEETLEIYVKHEILRHPKILIAGHNQFSRKACPSFYVPEYLEECFGINKKNLYNKNPFKRSGY